MTTEDLNDLRGTSRREFIKAALVAGAFPAIMSARVLRGETAPSNIINVAQIGCGRIARSMDIPGIMQHRQLARIVAVCDIDAVRLQDAKELVEQEYAKAEGGQAKTGVKTYTDYREMLKDPSIDAVAISTPDHWHALPAIEAALAGKDIYLQKPASLTISEGRQMADVVTKSGRIFQMGSQQRSEEHFRYACELVRNGYIGNIKKVTIGLPGDPAGGSKQEQPVPQNLDYRAWLGSTPHVPYTEERVHPQTDDKEKRYGRPGWLRCEQFGAGMITGWGTHHLDIAHWALGYEHSGPQWIEATASFPSEGLWDVHGDFNAELKYANGALVMMSNKFPVGVRFEGDEGWIWVTRKSGAAVTKSDPSVSTGKHLDASDPKILEVKLKDSDVHLHKSVDGHLGDWLHAIKSRKPAVAPAEDGHRSCSGCLLVHTAMKAGGKLHWDPEKERFIDDADGRLAKFLRRPQTEPYGTEAVLKKHGIQSRI
ncbi:MAG: Gfo/Idh/MocA family protein [Candidatus Sumerlaeaceae bacterium]